MNTLQNNNPHPKFEHSRDMIAALSSIIPGLGHLYKAHYLTGIGLIIVSPFIVWAGVICAIGTLGLGLFIPLIYLGFVIWHAYNIEDRRHHPAGIL